MDLQRAQHGETMGYPLQLCVYLFQSINSLVLVGILSLNCYF